MKRMFLMMAIAIATTLQVSAQERKAWAVERMIYCEYSGSA